MFDQLDLHDLRKLLDSASAVVAMRDVANGNHSPDAIALRHDVDDNARSFETAQTMARWEAAHGYRSTFFVLHTASYWSEEPFFRAGLEEIALAGHEIGIHTNAIAHALLTGRDPDEILFEAIDQLRDWGHVVVGAASHGDGICRDVGFVNYEQFTECARDGVDPCRKLIFRGHELQLQPITLGAFGLKYESYHLPKSLYLSDTGGQWNLPLERPEHGQLHVLQHSDWWHDALSPRHLQAAV